jgi:hypothetical protein
MSRKVLGLLLLVIVFSGCKKDKEEEKNEKPVSLRFEKESLVKKREKSVTRPIMTAPLLHLML